MKIKVKESGYMDASKVYNALEDGNYFTSEELVLVTDGWGLNTDTLDRICQVRYGMDADQLLAEGASEKKQEDGTGPKKPYTVIVKAEVTSRESVRATDPVGAERLAKMKVIERCSGVYNEAEVRVTSTEASLAESKDEESMVYAYTDVPLTDLLKSELKQHEFEITDYRPGKAVGKGMTVERNGKTADIWITEDAVAMEMLDTGKEYEFPVKAVTRGKAEDIAWLIRDIFDGNE